MVNGYKVRLGGICPDITDTLLHNEVLNNGKYFRIEEETVSI